MTARIMLLFYEYSVRHMNCFKEIRGKYMGICLCIIDFSIGSEG